MGRIAVRGELSLDGSGWAKTLRTAEGQVQQFGSQALGALKGQIAAAFSVGAIIAFAKGIVDAVGHIKDMSEQMAITTDEVQQFDRAAKHIGLSIEDVATALSRLGKARKDAAMGDVGMQQTFSKFGIDYSDLQNPNLRNLDLLKKMAEAMKGMQFNSAQREELRELFGKSGDKLAALFNELANMKPVEIIKNDQVEIIDKAKKDMEDIWTTMQAMGAKPISAAARIVSGETTGAKMGGAEELASYLGPAGILRLAGFGPMMDKFIKGENIQGKIEAKQNPLGFGASKRADLYGPTGEDVPAGPLYPGHFKYDIEANNAKIAAAYKEPGPVAKMNPDALVRVGNFLGDAPAIVDISKQQLQVQRDQLNELKGLRREMLLKGPELGF